MGARVWSSSWMSDRCIEQMRVRPAPVGDRLLAPLVENLFGEAEHPAGHRDGPEFGYRFITDELAEAGIVAGRKRSANSCGRCTRASVATTGGPGRRFTTTWSSESFTLLVLMSFG